MQISQKMATLSIKSNRIPALDFTKGALVLIMVLYHWLNYFYGSRDNRYLRFLTPSFIFITGFLISNVYFSKYGATDPRLPNRLMYRGLKIFGVFILLNVGISLLFAGNGRVLFDQLTVSNIIAIYVTGNVLIAGAGKGAAFYILVPISYLLLLSAALSIASRSYRYIFHVMFTAFLLGILVLYFRGVASPNLELLSIGLLGVICGYVPMDKIRAFVRHPYWLAIAYLSYVGIITVWNVVYPLQVVGVCLSLMVLYLLGEQSGPPGMVRCRVILLGKYSLFGYIAQIAILQLLRRGERYIDSENTILAVSFFLAFALTMVSVEGLDHARAGSKTVDRLYKAVFA
jgi:hypothetical protein